jgi:hypothetical protein
MKCKNKRIVVNGIEITDSTIAQVPFECLITNDEKGKTLSIYNGYVQFSVPVEPLEKWLR